MRISDWSSDVCSSDLTRLWHNARHDRPDLLFVSLLPTLFAPCRYLCEALHFLHFGNAAVTIPARVLIIAGSDSGGGAGIQADIKTVTMLGGYAMTAITALTAQNTTGVQRVMPVPADMVVAQLDSCITDIGVDAIKDRKRTRLN